MPLTQKERNHYRDMFIELYEQSPLYHVLDKGKLIIAHAGIKEELIGKQSNRVKTFVLYGDITGEKNDDGTPVRKDWASDYQGEAWIVYGHTPVKKARLVNKTANIDTGAVFGGMLTAFRYPELEVVSAAQRCLLWRRNFGKLNEFSLHGRYHHNQKGDSLSVLN